MGDRQTTATRAEAFRDATQSKSLSLAEIEHKIRVAGTYSDSSGWRKIKNDIVSRIKQMEALWGVTSAEAMAKASNTDKRQEHYEKRIVKLVALEKLAEENIVRTEQDEEGSDGDLGRQM